MLLNGINHIALISDDIDRLRAFYTKVFEAEVGPKPAWREGRRDHDFDPHRTSHRAQGGDD